MTWSSDAAEIVQRGDRHRAALLRPCGTRRSIPTSALEAPGEEGRLPATRQPEPARSPVYRSEPPPPSVGRAPKVDLPRCRGASREWRRSAAHRPGPSSARPHPGGLGGCRTRYLNRDGQPPDLAVAHGSSGIISVLINNTRPSFTAALPHPIWLSSFSVRLRSYWIEAQQIGAGDSPNKERRQENGSERRAL